MSAAARAASSFTPAFSISATCHRPVTMRLISSPGASSVREGRFMISGYKNERRRRNGAAPSLLSARMSVPDLHLDAVHIGGAHLADGGDFTVLDPPQAERSGDVAILIEADRADHPFILDRLAVLDELQRLGELVLAGMDDRAIGIEHLVD